jgi:hypothetical protein
LPLFPQQALSGWRPSREARPPGCTHRLTQNLTSRHQSIGHVGQDDIEKPALPNQMARGVEVRTKSAPTPQEAT